MAKETKQERIARGMFDQVLEHQHEIIELASNPATKELDVERWCQSVLRGCLGFSASNGYTIRAQESRGKLRPDLMILKGDKVICVVEVKKLDYDLNKSDLRSGKLQLGEYLSSLGSVPWGILTNGHEWRLFDFSNLETGGTQILSFDIRNEAEKVETGKRATDDVCWNFVELHEATFSAGAWAEYSREATAFSPESLAKAILSADVVKYIAREIRGEHDYRVNLEVLFDKLQHVIENGLDDAAHDWNEAKQAEMNKYVSNQKRSSRKKRAPVKGKVESTQAVGAGGAASEETAVSVAQGTDGVNKAA